MSIFLISGILFNTFLWHQGDEKNQMGIFCHLFTCDFGKKKKKPFSNLDYLLFQH